MSSNAPVCVIGVWGAYFDNVPVPDDFTIVIHFDAGGFPGAAIYTESGVASSRVPTGNTIGNVDEYAYSLTPAAAPVLSPGTYWLEVFNNTPNRWAWESGDGMLDAAVSWLLLHGESYLDQHTELLAL